MEVKIYIYIYILDTFLPTFFDYALSDLIFYGDDHFTRGPTYLFSPFCGRLHQKDVYL